MERLRKPAASIAAILGLVSVTACNVSAESLFPPSTSQSQKPNSTPSNKSSSPEPLQTENEQTSPLNHSGTTDMPEKQYLDSPERFEALDDFLQQVYQYVGELSRDYPSHFSADNQSIAYRPKSGKGINDRLLPDFSLLLITSDVTCSSVAVKFADQASGAITEYSIVRLDSNTIESSFSVVYPNKNVLKYDKQSIDLDDRIASLIKETTDELGRFIEENPVTR